MLGPRVRPTVLLVIPITRKNKQIVKKYIARGSFGRPYHTGLQGDLRHNYKSPHDHARNELAQYLYSTPKAGI